MSRWFVGCGLVALIAAIVIGYFAYSFVQRMGEFGEVQSEARAQYREVALAHPFSLEPGAPFESARLDAYLRVRGAAAEAARKHVSAIESSSGPGRVTAMFQGYAETARAHAEALGSEGMSLDEYRFFDQEVAVLVEEKDPAMSPLSDARAALIRRLESLDVRNVGLLVDVPFGPLVRAGRIVVPETDRERIRARAADLAASCEALLVDLFAELAGAGDFGG